MTVKEYLKDLKTYKDVMIVRNECILALSNPEYLLSVSDQRNWGKQKVKEVKERLNDVLIIIE